MRRVEKLTPHSDGRRRRMHMQKLTAVAMVPTGANPEANVTFFKSKDKPDTELTDTEKRGDLVDMFTGSTNGHQHGITIHTGEDGLYMIVQYATADASESNHDHMVQRNADGTFSLSENAGHTHDFDYAALQALLLDRLAKANIDLPTEGPLADLLKQDFSGMNEAGEAGENDVGKKETIMTDNATAKKEQDDRIAELEKQLGTATALAGLNDTQKTFYGALPDDAAKAEFLGKSADQRAAIVAEHEEAQKADNAVVYTADNGEVYTKSDDARLVQMAKDRDTDKRDLVKSRVAADNARMKKMAEDEFAHLPGSVETRVALIKGAESIKDDTQRAEALAALKAHNAQLAPAFTTVGVSNTPNSEPAEKAASEGELDTLAKAYAKEHTVSYFEAYEKVAEANPELVNKAIAG